MASTVSRPQANKTPWECYGFWDPHLRRTSDKSWPKCLRDVSDALLNLCYKQLVQFHEVSVALWAVKIYKSLQKFDCSCTQKALKSCPQNSNKLFYSYYCLCFREDEVNLTAQYQYEDNQVGDVDAFAREPFILHFNCPSTGVCCSTLMKRQITAHKLTYK